MAGQYYSDSFGNFGSSESADGSMNFVVRIETKDLAESSQNQRYRDVRRNSIEALVFCIIRS